MKNKFYQAKCRMALCAGAVALAVLQSFKFKGLVSEKNPILLSFLFKFT